MKTSIKNLKFFALIFVLFLQTQVFGQSIQRLGPNSFVAGVPSNEFEYFTAPRQQGKQRQSNWCWAACIQMTLNYHGLYVSQEQVVHRIFGRLADRPAGAREILAALSGWAADTRGRYSTIHAQYGVYSSAEIVNKLAYKWPIIVGLNNPGRNVGHAYVLTAVYFSYDYDNNPVIDRVVLRDPWPSSRSRQEMSWSKFLSRKPQFYKVWVNRL